MDEPTEKPSIYPEVTKGRLVEKIEKTEAEKRADTRTPEMAAYLEAHTLKRRTNPLVTTAPVVTSLLMAIFTPAGYRGYFNSPIIDFIGYLVYLGGAIFAVLLLYIGITKVIHSKNKSYWPPYTEILIIAICVAAFIYHLTSLY